MSRKLLSKELKGSFQLSRIDREAISLPLRDSISLGVLCKSKPGIASSHSSPLCPQLSPKVALNLKGRRVLLLSRREKLGKNVTLGLRSAILLEANGFAAALLPIFSPSLLISAR
jgi:hypothetical protein